MKRLELKAPADFAKMIPRIAFRGGKLIICRLLILVKKDWRIVRRNFPAGRNFEAYAGALLSQGASYFVTVNLAASLPHAVLLAW